jgi:hypothetical protein
VFECHEDLYKLRNPFFSQSLRRLALCILFDLIVFVCEIFKRFCEFRPKVLFLISKQI